MTVDELKARLREDLKAAMRAREPGTVSALRALAAAIDNAEAVPLPDRARTDDPGPAAAGPSEVARRALSAQDLAEIVERECAERLASADEYDRIGRPAEAVRLRSEAALVGGYR